MANMVITETETKKLAFIDSVDAEMNAMIDELIETRILEYRKMFNGLSRLDARLWSSCNIRYTIAFKTSLELDIDED